MAEPTGSDTAWAHPWIVCGITHLRDAYERSLTLGQDVLANWEGLAMQGLFGLRETGYQLSRNSDVNVRMIFDLAQKQAEARSASEICALYRQFLEDQSERLAHQMKDLETLVTAQMRSFHDEIRRGPRR